MAHPGGTLSAMDLVEGQVHLAPVGACIQLEGYDTGRLHDRVSYVDVGIPLEATSYALPIAR